MAPRPGTPALLRALNDRRALELLLEHGPLTRGRLGTLSGLSKQTAAQVVQRLEGTGLIEPVARVSAGRGPDAAAYGIVATGTVGVAVDARADALAVAVVDVTGTELAHLETPRSGHGPAEVARLVDAACAGAGVRRDRVGLAVVGVSASVDPVTDSLRFAEDFPEWPVSGVRRHLADALGCEVVLDNDVKLAAVAEREHGAGAGTGGFALVWMGVGVGVAVDLGGTVVRGTSGAAGEIGYLPAPALLQADDPVDPPTLHHLLSVSAVCELARRRGLVAPGDGEQDALLAVARDDDALGALARRVALAVAPVLAVLDPGLVVLGGPPAVHGGERLARLVDHWLAASTPWHTRVAATGVPDGAVLRGARDVLARGLRERLLASAGAVD